MTDAVRRPSLRAWAAFALGCLCFGYAFTQRVAPSVMTEDLMRAFAVGGGALGSLSAFYFYAYAGMQMPVGVLMDRFGPRKLLSGAMTLCLIGSLIFALAHSLGIASIGRAIIGASVACGYVGTMSIAAAWFPARRFSMLIGILQSVGMTGAMVGQAPLSFFVSSYGWRETIISLGVIGAILAVLIFFVVAEIPRSKPQPVTGKPATGGGAFQDVLSRRDSWACAILGFTLAAPMLSFAGLWAVPWLVQTQGFTKADAAACTSLIFLGWACVGPALGIMTEKIGRRKPILYAGFIMGALSLAIMIYVPNLSPTVLGVLFFLNGVSGCTMILSFTCVRETNRPSRMGAGLGFVNMAVVGSGALFQPLLGFILDLRWTGLEENGARIYENAAYVTAFSMLILAYAIGFIACILLRETHCKQLVQE
ncbi:MAG: MFS transporter [Rhodospirillaceae bacterium]|jgi:MFS family permease|uniref:MFS transporter n=1 Tax=unclassified Hwanghaeella TaxID=2605944 RepID=UPI000C689FC1|nr:MFS transporter [Rhodospirillales bacterium]MAX49100.1 MFS transporter [Rhodospirillaceae bacterium]|tara:strand:- start:27703 stop:28971 length:1269 start_codon:yes stop_codon:yes gene_type:complete